MKKRIKASLNECSKKYLFFHIFLNCFINFVKFAVEDSTLSQNQLPVTKMENNRKENLWKHTQYLFCSITNAFQRQHLKI